MSSVYKTAGVDIDNGNAFVDNIKNVVRETFTMNTLTDIGHFGAISSLRSIGESNICLVSSIDGVGSKTKLARIYRKLGYGDLRGIGMDIVNHCVNDILAVGARPLFFMDYLGVSKLDVTLHSEIVEGMAIACKENDCALVGGETAEMSPVYKDDEFDVVGSIVGVAKRDKLLIGNNIKPGNIILGIKSTGLHTNGYSIVNKLYYERKIEIGSSYHWSTSALMAVHASYFQYLKEALAFGLINGIAHITGGGFDNILRIIPDGLGVEFLTGSWEVPRIFSHIQKLAEIDPIEMFKIFNMGIGMMVVIHPNNLGEIIKNGLPFGSFYVIGQITDKEDKNITWKNQNWRKDYGKESNCGWM